MPLTLLSRLLLEHAAVHTAIADRFQAYKGALRPDNEPLQLALYRHWHRHDTTQADKVFERRWSQLERQVKAADGGARWCSGALRQLAEGHLEYVAGRLTVRGERLDAWQGLISCLSGLPIMAVMLAGESSIPNEPDKLYRTLLSLFGYRPFISPCHPTLEEYLDREGLSDVHIHLNGSTPFEQLWLGYLRDPEATVKALDEAHADGGMQGVKVRSLYALLSIDSPYALLDDLRRARYLRALLIDVAECRPVRVSAEWRSLNWPMRPDGGALGMKGCAPEPHKEHLTELSWQIRLHRRQRERFSTQVEDALHLYLLIQQRFYRLLVQSDGQYGFDQFQKHTLTAARDAQERSYLSRFHQLFGPEPVRSRVKTLEGRFSPKEDADALERQLAAIVHDYVVYLKQLEAGSPGDAPPYTLTSLLDRIQPQPERARLLLLPHFIKQAWRPGGAATRHQALRDGLDRRSDALFEVLRRVPRLHMLMGGIDSASNEMETPPEVFASTYRSCRRAGLHHATFHVGEDFEHLLCGLRTVFEALTFLDLKVGDRLGHATALGLPPDGWIDSMDGSVLIRREEWLLSLLFLRQVGMTEEVPSLRLLEIEEKIHELAYRIFDEDLSLHVLHQFWALRDLRPELVREMVRADGVPSVLPLGARQEEWQRVCKAESDGKGKALRLFLRYLDDKGVFERGDELEQIQAAWLSPATLLHVQQFVQREVVRRGVAVEVLPTSNVRISRYQRFADHHLFRWLGIGNRGLPGDARMMVCFGSDDPGIFATDIEGEAYHLFTTLQQTFEYDDFQALEVVKSLSRRGQIFSSNWIGAGNR